MTLSYKTVLTLSCVSFFLYSMEQKAITSINSTTPTNQPSKIKNYYQIDNLYKKAYHTLEHYHPAEISTIVALTEILTKTKELKTDDINERRIGLFAYNQDEPIKNRLFSYEKPPYHGPLYVSIFFERIAQYNANLEKNQFTSPTAKEFIQYINNKKRTAAIEQAAHFKVFIDLNKIDPEKRIIVDIPLSVATQDFEILLKNISRIQEVTPEEIRILAHILYGCDIKEKPENTPEKL